MPQVDPELAQGTKIQGAQNYDDYGTEHLSNVNFHQVQWMGGRV